MICFHDDIWVTGDHHFFHNSILRLYTNRPWDTVKEMNQKLIDNYRKSDITDESSVIFLGDLQLGGKIYKDSLERIIKKLPGQKHLVLGNHDRLSHRDYEDIGFNIVTNYLEIHPFLGSPEDTVSLVHDPAAAQDPDEKYITAHVHEKWKKNGNCVNAGVDVWDYKPVKLSELLNILF